MDWVLQLQKYIQIDTSQPYTNYSTAIEYLIELIKRIDPNLLYHVHILKNKIPLLLVTKVGKSMKSILLNSHMDVINTSDLNDWIYAPFSGHYDPSNDKIYGRGTQDMKSQTIQYIATLYNLRDIHLDYTLHLSFVPQKECNGIGGLPEFIKTQYFRTLNVSFVIDEGHVSPIQSYLLCFRERTFWQFMIKIHSPIEHTGIPQINTCESYLRRFLHEIEKFRIRDAQANINKKHNNKIGYLTTINMTKINGGSESNNIIPHTLYAYFDMYIGVEMNLNFMYDEIHRWLMSTAPNSENISIEWIRREQKNIETDLNNEMMKKFLSFFNYTGTSYILTTSLKSTDAKYFRQEGIPVIGFTPINMTQSLVYNTNEFIYKKQFLDNINLMTNLINFLAN